MKKQINNNTKSLNKIILVSSLLIILVGVTIIISLLDNSKESITGSTVGWNKITGAAIGSACTDNAGCGAGEICDLIKGTCQLCQSVPAGLIGWWPGDGNAKDLYGDSSGTGEVSFTDQVSTFGNVSKSFIFDGIDDGVFIAPSQNQNTDIFTIDAWVNPTATNDIKSILTKFDDARSPRIIAFLFEILDGKLRAAISNTGEIDVWVDLRGSAIIPTNTWTHVAVTFDGSVLKLYVNGQLDVQQAVSFSRIFDANTVPLYIGRDVTGRFFAGQIDEVEFYSRALTDSEIQAIYNANSAGKCKPTCGDGKVEGFEQCDGANLGRGTCASATLNPDSTGTLGCTSCRYNLLGCTSPCLRAGTTSGLISWWPGDGNADDIFDDNPGTLSGATTSAGLVGQAFTFDGIDDGVFIAPSANQNTDIFTIDAWVNPTATNGIKSILGKFDDSGAPRKIAFLFHIYEGKLRAVISNTGEIDVWVDLRGSATIPVNTWSHVAATFDGSVLKLYINGQLDAQQSVGFSTISDQNTVPLYIGRSVIPYLFAGQIDEVEFYSRALSADQIRAIYNANSAGKCKPTCGDGKIEGFEQCDGTNLGGATCASASLNPGATGTLSCASCEYNFLSCTIPCVGAGTTSGAISWWPGDGNANDIIDANTGTLQNGATTSAGLVGQAFTFDGSDDGVFIAPSANQNTDIFTIDAWVNPTATNGLRSILGKYDDSGAPRKIAFIFHILDGKLRAAISNTGEVDVWAILTGSATIPINTWTHVAVTFDGSVLKLYVNGQLDAQQSVGFSTISDQNTVPLYIGRSVTPYLFAGQIDEVEFYSRALTEYDIKTIYQAGSSGKCKGAGVALPVCDETQATDLSGDSPPNTDVNDLIRSANVAVGNTVTVSPTGKGCEMPQSITVS